MYELLIELLKYSVVIRGMRLQQYSLNFKYLHLNMCNQLKLELLQNQDKSQKEISVYMCVRTRSCTRGVTERTPSS